MPEPRTLIGFHATPTTNCSGSFYRARYYDPIRGRFLSEDPILQTGTPGIPLALRTLFAQPQLLHKYAYARNNPLHFADPYGLWSWSNFGIGLGQTVSGLGTMGVGVAMIGGTLWLSGGNIPLTIGMGVLSLPVWAAGILELQHGVERLAEELKSLKEQAPESERCGTYPRRG